MSSEHASEDTDGTNYVVDVGLVRESVCSTHEEELDDKVISQVSGGDHASVRISLVNHHHALMIVEPSKWLLVDALSRWVPEVVQAEGKDNEVVGVSAPETKVEVLITVALSQVSFASDHVLKNELVVVVGYEEKGHEAKVDLEVNFHVLVVLEDQSLLISGNIQQRIDLDGHEEVQRILNKSNHFYYL